jgi:uncharacterized protein YlxW (UPF0749 family)
LNELLITLVSVLGGGILAVILAYLTGAIVPGSRLAEMRELLAAANAKTETLLAANGTLQKTVDTYEAEMKRTAETQQVANKLLDGIKDYLKKPGE